MGHVKGQNGNGQLLLSAESANDHDNRDLGVIEEESEDDESVDDEGHDVEPTIPKNCELNNVEDHMFPQAFSHFSFEITKRNFIVVDLQDVFQKERDGTHKYFLTDPAIHTSRYRSRATKYDFGRTDRGRTGVQAFFQTHKCNCTGLTLVDASIEHNQGRNIIVRSHSF